MNAFGSVFRGMRVLLSGHTGFKGSWLALWLEALGAEVMGIALPPATTPSHWNQLDLGFRVRHLDIRDAGAIAAAIADFRPEAVFHLAAQALVRRSYRDPLETWSTNVMGTANVLDACRKTDSVQAAVVVTTDKCYQNNEWPWGYRETDALGGHDAYSASKAATELVTASYRSAFFTDAGGPLVATARAGNVIGGGDWSEDRLIPDLVRAMAAQQATGDSVAGRDAAMATCAGVVERLLAAHAGTSRRQARAGQRLEFRPVSSDNRPVIQILELLRNHWPALSWHTTMQTQPHEARLLYLDSAKARLELEWSPIWELNEALQRTAEWYQYNASTGEILSRPQLEAYVERARSHGAKWAA